MKFCMLLNLSLITVILSTSCGDVGDIDLQPNMRNPQESIVRNSGALVERITGTEDIAPLSKSDPSHFTRNNQQDCATDACTPNYALKVPKDPNQTITVNDVANPRDSLAFRLPPVLLNAEVYKTSHGTIIYQDTRSNVDLAVQPMEKGFRSLVIIKNHLAPNTYRFAVTPPPGSRLVSSLDYFGNGYDTKEVFVVNADNIITAVFTPAWAEDANGKSLVTDYSIEGNTLVQRVDFDHYSAFPIVADPTLWQVTKCVGAIAFEVGTTLVPAGKIAKIAKIKKYIKALGGVKKSVTKMMKVIKRLGGFKKALISLKTKKGWKRALKIAGRYGGKPVLNLFLELVGFNNVKRNCMPVWK